MARQLERQAHRPRPDKKCTSAKQGQEPAGPLPAMSPSPRGRPEARMNVDRTTKRHQPHGSLHRDNRKREKRLSRVRPNRTLVLARDALFPRLFSGAQSVQWLNHLERRHLRPLRGAAAAPCAARLAWEDPSRCDALREGATRPGIEPQ